LRTTDIGPFKGGMTYSIKKENIMPFLCIIKVKEN